MLTSAVLLKQNVGDIIVDSGTVGVTVLLIITFLSVVSWAITLDKVRALKRSARQTRGFLKRLPSDFSILEAGHYARGAERSSLARILVAAGASVESDVALLNATIFGLGAAIPALVAYNYFVNAVRRENAQMESFIAQVAGSIAKEIQSEVSSSRVSV